MKIFWWPPSHPEEIIVAPLATNAPSHSVTSLETQSCSWQYSKMRKETDLDHSYTNWTGVWLTHEFFQDVSLTVVRKINSELLFFISVPQVAAKLYPQVHKHWITPVNHVSNSLYDLAEISVICHVWYDLCHRMSSNAVSLWTCVPLILLGSVLASGSKTHNESAYVDFWKVKFDNIHDKTCQQPCQH
jgi:hypothetical protein